MQKRNTRDFILLEAFKLYATKTYEQASFTELEEKTGLTRGAIMYYFKTKEILFTEVCDKFLLKESSILDKLEVKANEVSSLNHFISEYISIVSDLKEYMKNLGIKNYNKAFINVTLQATFYYPSFEIKASKWQTMQIYLWKNMIKKAIQSGEIRSDIDCDVVADLFEDVYCGISYAGLVYPDGIDINRLQNALKFVYNSLKETKIA
ncbi:MAG: TetR/AcrR family transcriptional regulator [Prevotella sp.]|jgi:AcrR family transcriptional regulator|nr:TetR/AcrR family transcriptional regulator [Prevotella sp.]